MTKREVTDLSYKIVGLAIKVHKELGAGLLESIYERCLKYELEKNGLIVQQQLSVPVIYDSINMNVDLRVDLLVNDMTYRAVNDGFVVLFESHFKRNYIHVMDVVQAFLLAIRNHATIKGNIYNVGLSTANVSKRALCQIIKEHVPRFEIIEASIAKDKDQRNYIVSNEKIESVGFTPKYTLNDGVEQLIKGYTMIKNTKYGNI